MLNALCPFIVDDGSQSTITLSIAQWNYIESSTPIRKSQIERTRQRIEDILGEEGNFAIDRIGIHSVAMAMTRNPNMRKYNDRMSSVCWMIIQLDVPRMLGLFSLFVL